MVLGGQMFKKSRLLFFISVFLAVFLIGALKTDGAWADVAGGTSSNTVPTYASGAIYNGAYWAYYKINTPSSSGYDFYGYSYGQNFNSAHVGTECNDYGGFYILHVAGSSAMGNVVGGDGYDTFFGFRTVGDNYSKNSGDSDLGFKQGVRKTFVTDYGLNRYPSGLEYVPDYSGVGIDAIAQIYYDFYTNMSGTPPSNLPKADLNSFLNSDLQYFCAKPPATEQGKTSVTASIVLENSELSPVGLNSKWDTTDYRGRRTLFVTGSPYATANLSYRARLKRNDAKSDLASARGWYYYNMKVIGGYYNNEKDGSFYKMKSGNLSYDFKITDSNKYPANWMPSLTSSSAWRPSYLKGTPIEVGLGQSVNVCFYTIYTNKVYYPDVTKSSDRSVLSWDSGGVQCIDIKNPVSRFSTSSERLLVNDPDLTGNGSYGNTKYYLGNGVDTNYVIGADAHIDRQIDGPDIDLEYSSYRICFEGDPGDPDSCTGWKDTDSIARNAFKYAVGEVTVSVPIGETKTFCPYIEYDSVVSRAISKYGLESRYPRYQDRTSISTCVEIENPVIAVNTNFNGWNYSRVVAPSTMTRLSDTEFQGDGIQTEYEMSFPGKIQRDDSYSVSEYVKKDYSNYYHDFFVNGTKLSTSGRDSTNYLEDLGSEVVYGRKKIVAAINETTTVCTKLHYESTVPWEREAITSSTFIRQSNSTSWSTSDKCATITNPGYSYTSNFTADTSGYLNAHKEGAKEWLVRSNNNLTGTIQNVERDTKTGKWNFVYPSNSKFTGHFTHNVKRNDSQDINSKLKSYIPNGTNTTWYVEQSSDGANWSTVKSGGTYFAGLKESQVVYNEDVNVYNYNSSSSKGSVTNYCQRIRYYSKSTYSVKSNPRDKSQIYLDGPTRASETTSSMVCVTIKNPDWIEETRSSLNHNIEVTGEPSFYDFVGANKNGKSGDPNGSAVKNRDGKYVLTSMNDAIAAFNHKLTRVDSGYDESSDPNFYPGNKSMSSDSYNISVGFRAEALTIKDTISEAVCRNPFPNDRFGSCTPYVVGSLKNNGDVWNSSVNSGRTTTTVGYNSNNPNALYSLLAGQEASVCHSTVVSPSKWTTSYGQIWRREVYYTNGRVDDSLSGVAVYDRTELQSNSAEVASSSSQTFGNACVTVRRDWNYKITKGQYVETSSGQTTLMAGQTWNPVFHFNVSRDDNWENVDRLMFNGQEKKRDYLTGLNSTACIIKYVVKGNDGSMSDEQWLAKVSEGAQGGVLPTNSCDFLNSKGILDLDVEGTAPCTDEPLDSADVKAYVNNNVSSKESDEFDVKTKGNVIPVLPVGDKYCIAIVFTNYSSTKNNVFLSTSSCTNISKRPNFQVLGGGVGTMGGVQTTSTTINIAGQDNIFGSWTDFETIAAKSVKKFSSGNGIVAEKANSAGINNCGIFPLTISNSDNCKNLGNSGIELSGQIVERLVSKYNNSELATRISLGNGAQVNNGIGVNLDNYANSLAGTLFIHGSGDLKITSNIVRGNRVFNSNVYPNVIIVAEGNITVAEDVERVDAWLVAKGTIDTCDNNTISAVTCNKQLRISGPMIGAKYNFDRTYGADYYNTVHGIAGGIDEGAEVIDLDPGAYINGSRESNYGVQPRITYKKTMAPRY